MTLIPSYTEDIQLQNNKTDKPCQTSSLIINCRSSHDAHLVLCECASELTKLSTDLKGLFLMTHGSDTRNSCPSPGVALPLPTVPCLHCIFRWNASLHAVILDIEIDPDSSVQKSTWETRPVLTTSDHQ